MDRHKTLLEKAVIQYTEVLNIIKTIEASIDSFNTDTIEQLCSNLEQSMQVAKSFDEELSRDFPDPSDNETQALDEKRKELMVSILKKIESMAPRLQALRAIQLNDMKHLKHGRVTARGYAQQVISTTGGIINAAK